jgi:hypothetical protein
LSGLVIHRSAGEIYVAGTTDSTDFPGSAGGARPTNAASADAFVARLVIGV